ncbi:MAG: pantoate--beta-alanine ligase [Thioalkalivibrionaceae bacterium]
MESLFDLDELRRWRAGLNPAASVALVPTMGALHEGHLSLIESVQDRVDYVVASVFVNPLQFDDQSDLAAYPREIDQDAKRLVEAGVDALYAPSVEDMYPPGVAPIRVEPPAIANVLEGAYRRGHFSGVATVVVKLFNRVAPAVAVFGEKDFQQLKVIEAVVRGLDLPVKIVSAPVVRESSGLAMSSRNVRLKGPDREHASLLYAELQRFRMALDQGRSAADSVTVEDVAAGCRETRDRLMLAGFGVDYVAVRQARDFASVAQVIDTAGVEVTQSEARDARRAVALAPTEASLTDGGDWVIVAAVRLGGVRLLDALRVAQPDGDRL